MTHFEKVKFCREINNDPIYIDYSHGIRCCCFRDVNGKERFQVASLAHNSFILSKPCNEWEEDYALEWIFNATRDLKAKLLLL